jgi:SAM-dependent methyltransferase
MHGVLRRAHGGQRQAGTTLDRFRLNGLVTSVAFGGRRGRVYRRIVELAGTAPGDRVLDVGCGSGYLLHRLQEYGAGECRGIDLMENRIVEGRERYPTLKLEVGSATELPYAEGEFDLVTQFTCLSSIVDGDVRLTVAREMRRVARGWILSYDLRGLSLGPLRRRRGETAVVPLDDAELRRLFGEPTLLRSTGLPLELAGHRILAALPPLRSHLLGIWRQGSR